MKLYIQFQIISKHHLNSNEKKKTCPIYTLPFKILGLVRFYNVSETSMFLNVFKVTVFYLICFKM